MAIANRSVWNITSLRAGEVGSYDPAALEETAVASATIPFGRIVEINGTAADPVTTLVAGTHALGVALVGNYASDYDDNQFLASDRVPVGVRGNFVVEVVSGQTLTVGGAVRVNTTAGSDLGKLTRNRWSSFTCF